MAVDPSIALAGRPVEIADPLQNAYKAQLLKSAMSQNDMSMLQQQQLRTTMAQEQGVNAVMGTQSNYLPPDATGVRRLKPEFETQLGRISHEAYGKYHKDINDQAANYYKQRKDQIDADNAEVTQAKELRTEALKLNWGTKSAYENAIAAGKSPEEATAIAEEASKKLYADAIAINRQLARYPRKPFNYQEANDAVQTLKTYPDYIAENRATKDALASRGEYKQLSNGNWGWFDKTNEKPPVDTGVKAEENWTLAPPAVDPVTNKLVFAKIERGSGKMLLDDTARPVDPKSAKKYSEAENRNLGFFTTLSQAQAALTELEKKVPTMPLMGGLYSKEPGLPAAIKNALVRAGMTSEQIRAYTAAKNFVMEAGYLRSGATIREDEFNESWNNLIPQSGDDPKTQLLKKQLREGKIEAARHGAGAAYDDYVKQKQDNPGQGPPPNVRGATQAPDAPRPAARALGADGKWKDEPATEFGNVQSGGSSAPAAAPAGPYGKREDGTEKGEGYFGTIPRPDGKVSGELSIGVDINGKETLIPTMVPTLSKPELDFLLSANKDAIFDKKNPMAVGIVEKARAYAEQRIAQGKSVWAGPGEKHPLPVEFPKEMTQHLREGYERDFTVDGVTQTWTLKSGVPTRVR